MDLKESKSTRSRTDSCDKMQMALDELATEVLLPCQRRNMDLADLG